MMSDSSDAPRLVAGGRLDRYDLLLQVAEGGMAVLWLARQQGKHGFDKIVAIKTISPKLASDAAFRRMFLDEARVVARIEHPNVAQVFDLGEENGVLFLVMEWIDGDSLVNVGRAASPDETARIPVGVLARVMADACAGLHAAHELADQEGMPLNVVHRDVSPHNLVVAFGGTTKVVDFGIVKARNRKAKDTGVGVIKGKIGYMAPEQAMGLGVDRRTDVWGAGATMYRFLAGRVPYRANDPVAVYRRVAAGQPPEPLPPTVPKPIRSVVERALELDAENRFATAEEMRAALETAMRTADVYRTSQDVAAFMAEHLGHVRAARAREIERAVRESRSRMRVHPPTPENETDLASPHVTDNVASGSRLCSAQFSHETRPGEGDRDSASATLNLSVAEAPVADSDVGCALTVSAPEGSPAKIVAIRVSQRSPPADEGTRIGRLEDALAEGMRPFAQSVASVSASRSVGRRATHWTGRWIVGLCAFGVLLVCVVAWCVAVDRPGSLSPKRVRVRAPSAEPSTSTTSAPQ
jgi:serine/threonine protein kinase